MKTSIQIVEEMLLEAKQELKNNNQLLQASDCSDSFDERYQEMKRSKVKVETLENVLIKINV